MKCVLVWGTYVDLFFQLVVCSTIDRLRRERQIQFLHRAQDTVGKENSKFRVCLATRVLDALCHSSTQQRYQTCKCDCKMINLLTTNDRQYGIASAQTITIADEWWLTLFCDKRRSYSIPWIDGVFLKLVRTRDRTTRERP